MRVDVVDVVGRQAGVADGVGDAADDRLAVRARTGAVEGVGHLAAAFEHAEDLGAARLGGFVAFQHQRAGAFRHHEAVAGLGERTRGFRRLVVLRRQRRQQREADHGFRIDRAVGADAQRGAGLAAADRLDAKLDRGRTGGAGRRQRDRRAARAELLGDVIGDRAEQEALVVGRKLVADAQQVVVGDFVVGAGGGAELEPLRPFHLDRRHGEEEGTRKRARRADAGLRDGFFGRQVREVFGQRRGAGLRRQIVDGAGDARLHAVGGKARDGADAGFAGRQLRPVVDLAGAEGGDHAEAGDHHDRTAHLVLGRSHVRSPQPTRSTSARPSPRQWPTPVTRTWLNAPLIGFSRPEESQGGNRLPWASATVARATFMGNCGSSP